MMNIYDMFLWNGIFCSKLVVLEDIQSIAETDNECEEQCCYRHDSCTCQILFLHVCGNE